MSSGDKWCVHRTPFGKEHKTCKVGVDFHKFPMGTNDMPCLGQTAAAIALCSQYLAKTPEELAAREAMLTERFARIGIIRAEIVKRVEETKQRSGSMPCPACKTGTVRYSQAQCNGHVHAACSTKDCAHWME